MVKYFYNNLDELKDEEYYSSGKLVKKLSYSYDAGGNIKEKSTVTYSETGEAGGPDVVSYLYNDSAWKDLLTSYNGQSLSYDAIGNLTGYAGYNYTWEGRALKSITGNGLDVSFKYNSDGIRTEKVSGSKITKYYLVGDEVTYQETIDTSSKAITDRMYFIYDAAGNLVSMELDGVRYDYIRNAQGDITGLMDMAGSKVVSYSYDSWGKLQSIDGSLNDSLGVKNPYRYRGYRYDTETGLYYLQSRYYNPEWGRFINADAMVSGNGDLLEHNIFAYCSNNPVNRADSSGYIWETVLDIAGIGWSAYDLVTKPSWGNDGMLAWDVGATLIPFVPGSYTAKTAKITSKVVSKADNVVNALSKFVSRKMYFGNKTFLLDKSAMKHILTRHHPKYWDGSVKAAQSFLDKSMSIDEIANTIQSVMKQNRGTLIQKGTRGTYQIRGYVDGVEYVVGLKNGRVGQFYPVR